MDIVELTHSLAYGNPIADAASMLCRGEDEVRQKAKERGLSRSLAQMRPGGRADQCPQFGVERTQRGGLLWAVHDSKRPCRELLNHLVGKTLASRAIAGAMI
jgi:hypothetical protein